jgi:UDP-glucose 4-epimerase
MIKTYILGSGNLSQQLKKKIYNSEVYSAKTFIKKINSFNKKIKINLIINSFYSSMKLRDIKSYSLFVNKAHLEIAKVLDSLNPKILNKIIYTSSSSVYGISNNKVDLKDNYNRNIYAAFKFSGEFLIKNFCEKKNIKYTICRVFNMYGGNDKFSIIQKMKNAKQKKLKIKIFNNGKSIRDYIHIDDVSLIYDQILKKKINPNLYDIGTGKGVSLMEIVKNLI